MGRALTPKAFSRRIVRRRVPAPRWLADEMLGRLARYLRFFGHDTEYVRGLSDAEIAGRAGGEGRRLVTRDRDLARQVAGAILLESPFLPDQLRSVRALAPEAGYRVTFERCTVCNGALHPWSLPADTPWPAEMPRWDSESGRPIFECADCGHRYWEGSHTASLRLRVAGWLAT